MPTIKLEAEDICWTLFEAYQWRTETNNERVNKILKHLMNQAIEARKNGEIEASNEFISMACSVKSLYQCVWQGNKKNRRAFGVKEEF